MLTYLNIIYKILLIQIFNNIILFSTWCINWNMYLELNNGILTHFFLPTFNSLFQLNNETLLAKWKWRFATENYCVCWNILLSKYGYWREFNKETITKYESIWWRNVKKVTRLVQYLNWFDNNLTWRLWKGNKFNFWHDKWNGELSLAQKYSRMYINSIEKQLLFSEMDILE